MLSHLKLCQLIESGFVPLHCRCEVSPGGSLVITIFEASSGDVELCVTGVSVSSLTSTREIMKLIGELRAELLLTHGGVSDPLLQGVAEGGS